MSVSSYPILVKQKIHLIMITKIWIEPNMVVLTGKSNLEVTHITSHMHLHQSLFLLSFLPSYSCSYGYGTKLTSLFTCFSEVPFFYMITPHFSFPTTQINFHIGVIVLNFLRTSFNEISRINYKFKLLSCCFDYLQRITHSKTTREIMTLT
jgi:hypothetical protein